MNNDTLIRLEELQEIDIQIDSAKSNIAEIEKKTLSLQDGLTVIKDNIESLKREITQSNVAKKEKELAVAAAEDGIKKHNMELNTIKSNDAYKALLKEINDAKRSKDAIEDEILVLMEAEEIKSSEIRKLQQEYAKSEKEFAESKSSSETEIKANEGIINDLTHRREIKIKELPLNLVKQYENIRKNKKGHVVVEIKDGICGGCHRNLPLQAVDHVMKGKDIILCDHCQRILFVKK